MIGLTFGRLTVTGNAERVRQGSRMLPAWLCVCECGKTCVKLAVNLRTGRTKSCGCLPSDRMRKMATKHGDTSYSKGRATPEWKAWQDAKKRTSNPSHPSWDLYGGRGIHMCPEWRDSFSAFLNYMGRRPKGLTLERVDVNGNYEPGNCIWASQKAQLNNRRNNVRITFNGQTKTIMQWSEETGLEFNTIRLRIKRGWPVDLALTKPSLRKLPCAASVRRSQSNL